MAGKPWERFAQAGGGGKPWEKFQQPPTPEPQAQPKEKSLAERLGVAPTMRPEPSEAPRPRELLNYDEAALDERHPAISFKDRAIVKNFSNSPDSAVAYLQKQYPGFEISHDPQGISIKAPGDEWPKRLDPSTIEFEDLSDIGTDVAAGVIDTAATAGGATLGLMAGPAGIVPGAMIAAGGAGAITEAGRQRIGQELGIPQKVDMTDVMISGGVSGAMPGFFGAAPLKKGIENYAKENLKGLSKEAIDKLMYQNERGLLKRGYDYGSRTVAPWIAEKASGVNRNVIKHLGSQYDRLVGPESLGATPIAETAHNKLVGGIAKAKNEAGKRLEAALNGANRKISTRDAKKLFEDHINELKGYVDEMKGPDGKIPKDLEDAIKNADAAYGDIFLSGALADDLSAKSAFRLQQALKDEADLSRLNKGPMPRFASSATSDEKQLAETARKGYTQINKEFENATDGLSQVTKNDYRYYAELQKDLQPYFSSPEKTFQTLSGMDKNSRRLLYEKLQKLADKDGIDLSQDMLDLETLKIFSNPSSGPLSSGGTTSTSRTIPLAIMGGSIGSLAGYNSGGGYAGATVGGAGGAALGAAMGSPAAIKSIIKAGRYTEKAGRSFRPKGNKPVGMSKSTWEMMKSRDKSEED
jgi:hypothetical protein